MVMVNDSTNSMRSSAISNVFIVLFTFLAHGYSHKWSPLVICKVILVHTTVMCLLQLWNISPRTLQISFH